MARSAGELISCSSSHQPSQSAAMAPWGSVSPMPSILAPCPLFLLPSWPTSAGSWMSSGLCPLSQFPHPISPATHPSPLEPPAAPGLHHMPPTYSASSSSGHPPQDGWRDSDLIRLQTPQPHRSLAQPLLGIASPQPGPPLSVAPALFVFTSQPPDVISCPCPAVSSARHLVHLLSSKTRLKDHLLGSFCAPG